MINVKKNIIQLQITIITYLLFVLASCNEPIQNNHVSKKYNLSNFNSGNLRLNESNNKLDQNIRSIFQDRNGNYWFGTNSAGIYRYDKKKLTQFTVEDGLASNQVISIQEDELGNIWVGTGAFSICKFDGKTFAIQTNKVNLTNGTETKWKSTNKDLWFFAGDGVFKQSYSSLVYLPFDPARTNDPFKLSRYGVYCILKDTKGNIWFGTQAEGVCKYDGGNLTWFKEKGLAGPAVLGLFEDSKGNLWFGNNGAGLFCYDGKTLTNFTEEKGLDNPDFRVSGKLGLGTLARVYSINEDIFGNIWIGTVDAGVWKYDGNNLTNYTTKNGLTSNSINTIYKDKNGELWFGTDSNGICKFNGTKFTEFVVK